MGLGVRDSCCHFVGILTEQVHGENQSMIASSYVKFLESAGARVMPILSVGVAKTVWVWPEIIPVLYVDACAWLHSMYNHRGEEYVHCIFCLGTIAPHTSSCMALGCHGFIQRPHLLLREIWTG